MDGKGDGKKTEEKSRAEFKAKVALAAFRGDKTLSELAEQFDVHPHQITEWKKQLLERVAEVFDRPRRKDEPPVDLKALHAKIGAVDAGERFFRRRAHQGGHAERKAMIDPKHELGITRQAELVGISRAAVYYEPRPISEGDLLLMRRIDELHLEWPFAGARMLKRLLCREGLAVGRKRVATLMRRMGIEALYCKKSTSRRHPEHAIYPYLLRNVAIERPNQVWALDITYIPMRRGFVYFCAVMDWASRRILGFRLSNTLTADFCVEALEEAIGRYGKPEIVNTDQGTQFTGSEFIDKLKSHEIAISMDGKGCWRDNVFIERFWKTLKHEEVYLRAYETVSEARVSIGRYIERYNAHRPHSALEDRTPDEAYFSVQPMKAAA